MFAIVGCTKYQSIYTLVTFKMVLLLYKLGNWFFSLVDDVNAMLISFGKGVNYALHMEPDRRIACSFNKVLRLICLIKKDDDDYVHIYSLLC